MTGFDSVTTTYSWPTIQWWLIAALLFGLIMLIAAVVFYVRREPKTGTIALAAFLVPVAAAIGVYWYIPVETSKTETTHVVAWGPVVETVRDADGASSLGLRLSTDPTWQLIVHGDDAKKLADVTGTVALQCEWGTTTMDCSTEMSGAPRPQFVPWFAEVKELHAVLLPALIEGQ